MRLSQNKRKYFLKRKTDVVQGKALGSILSNYEKKTLGLTFIDHLVEMVLVSSSIRQYQPNLLSILKPTCRT